VHNWCWEVTESVLDLDARTTYANLTELRAQGVRIAIDDFGTGYSSLSRLASLPTDILKLDASFVAAVQADSPPPPLLSVIAKLSEKLGLPVIIEGVENDEQAAVLEPLGFTLAQGFYYGRPQEMDILVASADAARHADTRR
jgi:diguanylate cyclase